MQLRRSRADEWVSVVYDTLGSFYSPDHLNLDLSATEKIMLTGLHANHNLWSELNKDTKRKYRKLAREVAKEDELTNHLKSSFSSSIEQLGKELNSWLIGMNVVFEKEENEVN